jgi:hypothetical protein
LKLLSDKFFFDLDNTLPFWYHLIDKQKNINLLTEIKVQKFDPNTTDSENGNFERP